MGIRGVSGSIGLVRIGSSPPEITSSASPSVAENTTAVVAVTATRGQTPYVFSISGGADQALFTINSSTGALAFAVAPDFESPTDVGANNVYNVTVRVASVGGAYAEQNIAVTVTDVFDFTPADFGAALVWWMDPTYQIYSDAGVTPCAVDGLVRQWNCRATGDVYTAVGDGYRPTLREGANGKRYVDFTGGKALACATPTSKPLGNAARSFAIGLNIADIGDKWPFSYGSPADNDTFSLDSGGNLRIVGFNNDWTTSFTPTLSTWIRVDSKYDGSTIDMRVDAGTPETSSRTYDSDAGIAYIGGFSFVLDSLYYTGFMSHFFMTNTAFSTTERANADAFLIAEQPT